MEAQIHLPTCGRRQSVAVSNRQCDRITGCPEVEVAKRGVGAYLRPVTPPHIVGNRRAALTAGTAEAYRHIAIDRYG